MSKVIITSQKLVDLADAVRTHNSISDKLKLPDIPGMLNVGLAPGTYDASGNLLKSWSQLLSDGDVTVTNGSMSTPYKDITTRFANVEKVVIDPSVIDIRPDAFNGCTNLTEITIPSGVIGIGAGAFKSTSLTEITIPSGVISIGDYAFAGCTSLTEITLPDGIPGIRSDTFNGCTNLTTITIPDGITEIGYTAFEGCTSLTEITIPDSVTSIRTSAFRGCTNLTKIYYKGTATGAPWGATNATVITDF